MPEETQPDRLQPLIAALTCFLLYRIILFFLVPVFQTLGGQMVALTVPPLLAAAIASALAMAIFESRRIGESGLAWVEGSMRNLVIGVALGIGAAVLALTPAIAFGFAEFRLEQGADVSWRGALFAPLWLFAGALGEEIAFRGYALQGLMRGYGRWVSVVGVGALFGLMHAGNDGATILSTINTAGFGIAFGLAMMKSRDLWFPAGIHFAWNAALPLFGVHLSGLTIKMTGYELIWHTGEIWSGGKYGPEAGMPAIVAIVALVLAIRNVRLTPGAAWLGEDSSESP